MQCLCIYNYSHYYANNIPFSIYKYGIDDFIGQVTSVEHDRSMTIIVFCKLYGLCFPVYII